MKWLIPLSMVIVTCYCVTLTDVLFAEWTEFKLKYGKTYESKTEENFRMKIYLDNKNRIAKHNIKYEQGEKSFKLEMNKFGDLLSHEYNQMMNGLKINITTFKRRGSTFITPANALIPNEVDWSTKGAVTPIKDQGQCGSCYAFSSTGALEGQHFLKTGVLTSLSEQNIVDCSRAYGNLGCGGGLMDWSFTYILKNGGIDTEESYPYYAMEQTCTYSPKTIGATDTGFVDIPQGDEEKLKEAVATIGPISVAIDASLTSFAYYEKGIYCDEGCSSQNIDHAVLAIGYGTDNDTGEDYWLVKNSWGTEWGMNGYIKMCRNKNNHCGIASYASYPLV